MFAQGQDTPFNDYACTLALLLCGWLAATTLDASHWFNRNLAIITNIERLFLSTHDLKLVHYFFGRHRRPGQHAQHFSIQLFLSAAVCILVLAYHFSERVLPGLHSPWTSFEVSRAVPYLVTPVVLRALVWLLHHYKKRETEFYTQSPGFRW